MALDYDYLKTLSPDQGFNYLRDYYTQNPAEVQGGNYYEYNSIGPTDVDPGVQPIGKEMLVPSGGDRSYVVRRANDGGIDVNQQLADSWYDKDSGLGFGLPIGALLPFAAAAGAAALGPAMAGEGAAAAGGVSEAALGELGINTALPAGTAGAPFGASPWMSGQVAADVAGAAGEAVNVGGQAADWLTEGAFDGVADLGELGYNTSLSSEASPWLSSAADSAVPNAVADLGELGYNTGLPPGTPGAPGGASPWITPQPGMLDTLKSGAKSLYDTGKTAYNAVAPIASGGKKVYDWLTGAGSGSGTGLGGLGGLGGILGLALLMSQLNKDRNAQANTATPVIPRLRSKVQQNPFTLDAQGKKVAPLSHFGTPTYYAGGGGIGGLAAGGNASRPIRGGGDGVSDSIPAQINGNEPAALADGEFVIDARTVAELGNGSTDAGTRKLEAMVSRVHAARAKAKRGEDSGAARHMPA